MSLHVCRAHQDELVECPRCHYQSSCPQCGCWRTSNGFCLPVVVEEVAD
jgi:hypothetical protein